MSFGPGDTGVVYITASFEQWQPYFLGAVCRWSK
jgi:hypothetical protein